MLVDRISRTNNSADPARRFPQRVAASTLGRQLTVEFRLEILVGELIFTLALAYVVLNVTSAEATEGNSFYGLAIGFTVATGIFAVGKTTGGVFNLAAALGGSITRALTWSDSWIYILAGLLGGATASGLFAYLHPSDAEVERPLRSQARR